MFGFGIMDNLIMIQAGDFIDKQFGATLGITTLAAAALGQVFSDVSGVLFGGTVEAAAVTAGFAAPLLKAGQRNLPAARRAILGGGVCGVTLGCLVGASCLLFMDLDKEEREQKAKEMETVLDTVMRHGDEIIGAERCSVFIVDEEKGEMWSKYVMGDNSESHKYESEKVALLTVKISESLVGLCCSEKAVINIGDVKAHPRYSSKKKFVEQQNKSYDLGAFEIRDVLCAPVIIDGKVVAVVEFLNKTKLNSEDEKKSNNKWTGGGSANANANANTMLTRKTTKLNPTFTDNDEKLATMLAHHVALFMTNMA
ncbi:hypothetical protein ScalyP_jg577 [Parmales sp. scaly parma]|nr:hypothetical protein ScalyP_jg577 [Parmales sp. scaly parma]